MNFRINHFGKTMCAIMAFTALALMGCSQKSSSSQTSSSTDPFANASSLIPGIIGNGAGSGSGSTSTTTTTNVPDGTGPVTQVATLQQTCAATQAPAVYYITVANKVTIPNPEGGHFCLSIDDDCDAVDYEMNNCKTPTILNRLLSVGIPVAQLKSVCANYSSFVIPDAAQIAAIKAVIPCLP